MVLRGNGYLLGLDVLDRLVCPPVTELELVGTGADGMGQDLMAEANSEDGVIGQQGLDGLVGIAQCGWVARAIGQKYCVRFFLPRLLRARICGKDDDFEAMSPEVPVNGSLGPIVEGDEPMGLGRISLVGQEVRSLDGEGTAFFTGWQARALWYGRG